MTENAELYSMVMGKYRMSDTLTAEEQAFMLESRKRVLRAILKKYRKYSTALWFVIAVAIAFRNIGIKLSFIQAKVALGVALIVGAAGGSAASYAGAKYIYEHVRQRDVPEVREIISLESPACLKELPAPRPAAIESAGERAPKQPGTAGQEPPRSRVTVPSM
ncbi:MAG TPA: hypothetical protein PK573_07705 [Spirochaetota bacterium]|nr:hypothetical protein [Spirochaetota bacterium]HRZ27301.1 hypothetical protein [Spirochaetota bacterium]HSA14389.1 hypothetical protein [Spirochaetota bacterium]